MSKNFHAVVTGASAGLGDAYVRQLAQRCDSMLVVARRGDRLRELAKELENQCALETIEADLATTEGQARVVEAIRQGPAVDLLVNNAGYSTIGPYAASDLDDELGMLRLHNEATMVLTRAALPAMIEQGSGAVINVASVAGLVSTPNVAAYGATKAFLVSFTRALRQELKASGLRVQCLCPGYTRSEIHSRETMADFDVSIVPDTLWMEADEVVAESLAAIANDADQWLVVSGEHNRKIVAREMDALRADLHYPS
ncbi:SDR family oxidoreductase [Congregibacter brevis]|uniref:NADP-dependent 3-hydroxy acid dehydrogenase YdfG n=1 Tax=Congregibacter brevis TaxID=3081201 RepID=A0ABZ0IA29_9GAMM|nr:SDR family oxidoreductase [Congregibacter sp. IMCC45268]